MEKYVQYILSKSENESDVISVANSLREQAELMKRIAPEANNGLELLNPRNNCFGYMLLLSYKEVDEYYFGQACNLMNNALAWQMRLAPDRFLVIVKNIADYVIQIGRPIMGVIPLRQAAGLLQAGNALLLTPCHQHLLKVCLLAKVYREGRAAICPGVIEIAKEETGLDAIDVLLYFYYGGMIYAGLKEFHEAKNSFEMCFTVPASALSAVAVAAFKKYVLVSLLDHGKLEDIPRYIAPVVNKGLKLNCGIYLKIAEGFMSHVYNRLHDMITSNRALLEEDHNFGLAEQCLASLSRRNIGSLTQTYVTLSTESIAEKVGLPSAAVAETQVLQMIQNNEVNAVINQKDGMVSFLEDNEGHDSEESIDKLNKDIAMFSALHDRLEIATINIAVSREYVEKSMQLNTENTLGVRANLMSGFDIDSD